MKNFKRLVGLLLCLSMVLSFVPVTNVGAAESTGTSTQSTTTSDILEKIDISGTAVGGCSTNSATQSDYTKLSWWNDTHDWIKHTKVVDNSTTSSCDFGATLSAGERGDFYLDLTKKNGAAISADQLKLHYGAAEEADMPTVTITLDLETGSDVVKTFTTNWEGTTPGTPIEWDFGQTYDINGIYVYAEGAAEVSFAELELYHYIEVPYLETATLNGVDLSQYKIVYSDDEPDYNYTAAKYIKDQILMRTGRSVEIVTDSTAENACEILVGQTNRSLSASTSAPGDHEMKFTINASGTKVALEADYFIIAGAAYYFVDTYIGTENFENTVSAGSRELTPITKPAKNYIFLIGDGMGVMQTRLWEKHGPSPKAEDDATYGYSDGENIFYGEYLPYKGFSKTANVVGTITDSAAGGTALSTGYKTINGYVGRDQYENDIKNLSEIAWDMGKAVGIMSTEGSDGATPASFSAHTSGRYDDEVVSDQDILEAKGYVFVERYRGPEDAYNAVFKTYTAEEFGRWDAKVKSGMSKLVNDPDGFFVMYEEAYIDKLCHSLYEENNPNATTTEDIFRAMYRFNQHIAYFMEFAMYNPDTFVLITADHETGGLDENWNPTQFNVAPETGNDHSLQDVPVYVYGQGGEVFHGVTAENTSIGRTFAHIMTNGKANDFGDPQYPILLGSSSGEDVQLPTPEGLKATATTDTSITVTANGVYGGTLQFRIDGGEWQSSGIFTGLTASTTYTIEAMHDASAGYIDSDIATITVTTAEPAVKVELEPVPTNKLTNAMFGYYGQNISGDITPYYLTGKGPEYLIDGTISETRSDRYLYSDLSGTLENQQKVPVIYIELTEATVLGGVQLNAWQYNKYNPEDFMVQITTDADNDNWKTVATVKNAFEGTGTSDVTPIKVEFGKTYTAYKVRILVDSITDMSGTVTPDDLDYEELYYGGYIRVKEVTPLYDPSATPGQAPSDPTEPTTPPTQPTEATEPEATEPEATEPEATSPVGSAQVTVQSAIVGVYDDSQTRVNLIGQQDGSKIIDGELDSDHSVILGNPNDGGSADGNGWVFSSSRFAGNGGRYTPAAILTLSKATAINRVEVYSMASYTNGKYTPDKFTVQALVNGSWTTVGTYEGSDWFGSYATVSFNTVTATKIRVLAENIDVIGSGASTVWAHWQLPEIKVYGAQAGGETPEPTDPTEPTAPTNPTTPTDPDVLPDIVLKPVTNAPTPIVGYYTDNNTDGEVAKDNYWIQEGDKGKDPSVLVDGEKGEETGKNYNWTGYYTYDELATGAKIPVYLFEFDEPRAFTGVEIDGYKAMYYGMEDFTVQVYIEGKGWVTATTVADSFGAQTQEEYADPVTYPFAEPLYGTKIRILVDKIWNMYDWRYDDENSFNLEYEASIRLREITLMEDPNYVPPEDAANTLMPPSSLNTEFTDTTITAVAPPSTEYPEAEIRYAVYLDGKLVAVNSTGIFTGLQPNTRYTIYAKYIGDGDEWLDSPAISNTTATDKLKLPTPNVEVDLTSTSITATADKIEGGTLQFRLLDENHIAIPGKGWSENNSFTGLTPNTTYYIEARYNGDTNHYDSEVTELKVVTGKTLLNKPTLTVSGTTYNTITLNALPTVTGGTAEYSYRVEGGEWIVASGTVITGLNPDTTYYLRARYVATDDSYNNSLYSEVVSATTKKAPLPAPNVSVGDIHDSYFTVTAGINDNGTLMFSIDGNKWFEADAEGNYTFTGLNRNTEYTIQAKYVGKNGYTDSDIAETTATTLETKLNKPTGFTATNVTANSFTVKADAITGGTLMFRLAGGEWQTSGTFTGLTHGTTYTVEAMYDAADGYIDSDTTTIQVDTLTILDAPVVTATTVTDTSITVTAPTVTGGTLKFSIDGNKWFEADAEGNYTFTGLKSNTTYTIKAMYEAETGYVSSAITTKTVMTEKAPVGADGEYAYLEAIREADVTAHVGYNRYSNHEMLSENLEQSALINDAMFGTISKIMGAEAVPADKLADGYRLLSIVYDLNNGVTKLGAIEITGGNYNLTKFAIQVKNTKGVWQTVKFVTNDLFDISAKLKNDTVLIPFTPVEGTQVRLLINGYEANPNNYPEIRELVIYEVKENALQEKKSATSSDAAVVDGNKATYYTTTTKDTDPDYSVTLTFNEVTSVKRLKLFGTTAEKSIGAFTVEVLTEQNGEWQKVADGNAYGVTRALNTCIVNLDQEYKAYGVRITAAGVVEIPEIEVYGYFEAPEYKDPTPPTISGAVAPEKPTKPTVVSPVQTSPVATEKFEVPGTPDWVETTPVVPTEGAWSDPTPVVPDETGTEPTAPGVTPPTEEEVVMGWLDDVPASSVTPEVGYYKNGNYTTLTEVDDDESLYLSDACYAGGADVMGGTTAIDAAKAKDKTLVPAAVLTFDKTRKIGGIELVLKSNRYPKVFDIDVLTSVGWENVKSITSNTEGGTQIFKFEKAYDATAVRVRIYEYDDTKPQIIEFTALEVKTENPLVKVPITNIVTDTSSQGGNPISNLADGNKETLYQTFTHPGTYTMTLANGSYTSISRLKMLVHGNRNHTQVPANVTISVHTSAGWKDVYTGTAYQKDVMDYWFVDFGTYVADQIKVQVNSATSDNLSIMTEFEVFGTGEGYFAVTGSGTTGAVGSYTPEAPGYTEIPLSSSNLVGGCSGSYAARDVSVNTNFNNISWYFNWNKGNMNRLQGLVDDVTNPPRSTDNKTGGYSEWGMDPNEGADVFLNLDSSGTAIDQIKLYSYKYGSNYPTPKAFKVILLLKDGNPVEKTFNVENQWTADVADGTACTLDLGATYTVTGLYICATSNTPAITSGVAKVSLAEIELYKKNSAELDAPTSLKATTVTENSITVTAPAITTGGTLKYRINGGAWQTSGTFEGLTAGTTYTIDAMYVGTSGYTDSGVKTITVTTAAPTVCTVSGKIPAGAMVQLYKDTKPTSYTATIDADGNYNFNDVAIGNYYLVVTKAGHTTQMRQITVDKNLTGQDFTLTSAYGVSGTVTGSTKDPVTVELYQSGVVKYTATVTADGNNANYVFASVAIGNYKLVVTKHGHTTKIEDVTVSTGEVTKDVTLEYVTYTVSGTVNAGANVQLTQDGTVVDEVVATDGSYRFEGVDLGNYVLVVTKPNHIPGALSITVNKNLESQNITLNPVPVESTKVDPNPAVASVKYNVRLYEPWALRVKVTFYEVPGDINTAIPLDSLKSYGAYAVIAHKFGDGTTEPTSWEAIVNDPNAIQFRQDSYTNAMDKNNPDAGDYKMYPVSEEADETTALFDFYDGLYTYRLAENVYWVAYYEDMDGTIHFTEVRKPKLMDKVDNVLEIIGDDVKQETQRIVLEHMKQLHQALKDFRGEDAQLGNVYDQGVLNYGQNLGSINNGSYRFGKSHRIRLIEPWGIMINMQVQQKNGTKYSTYNPEDAKDYGLIFFHDKKGEYNGAMSATQMLARNDVYIFSESRGNAWAESWNTNGYMGITAVYDKDIFTYGMDSELYVLPFIVDADDNYHYSTNAYCMNLIDEMYNYYNRTNLKNEERLTFKAMIQLHESTLIHRKKYGN